MRFIVSYLDCTASQFMVEPNSESLRSSIMPSGHPVAVQYPSNVLAFRSQLHPTRRQHSVLRYNDRTAKPHYQSTNQKLKFNFKSAQRDLTTTG